MDFIEGLNESYELQFQEIGETGDPIFIIQDVDNDEEHRFYLEDVKVFIEFLNDIKEYSSPNHLRRELNESYYLEYHRDYNTQENEYVLVLKDIDNETHHVFYQEDIAKIKTFLNRLKGFGIIKN